MLKTLAGSFPERPAGRLGAFFDDGEFRIEGDGLMILQYDTRADSFLLALDAAPSVPERRR